MGKPPGTVPKPGLILSEQFARCLCVFAECSASLQETILALSQVVADPETDEDERAAAVATIAEALFPAGADVDGRFGIDLAESEARDRTVPEDAQALSEL